MQQQKLQKVKIDATTGEVYLSYPRVKNAEIGRVRKLARWINKQVDKHFDRLIELRVYDDRWYDFSAKK
ncbi:MAG: hypothetical protein QNJ69_01590 [Gammaproteobacteria bacterium]|nr:hypothetical protein [Gammaproteobacteria bacterium]